MRTEFIEADETVDRNLDGCQKTAALLLAMGKPSAARILRHFDTRELRDVTRAAAQLGSISNDTLETLIDEFTEKFSAGAHLQGDIGRAREMLADAIPPDQVAGIISDALGLNQASVWDALVNVAEQEIVAYLEKERVSTATYVLSKLDSTTAGKAITLLSRPLRNEIFCRLIEPPTISDLAARLVEDSLRQDLLTISARPSSGIQRARVAQLLNLLDEDDIGDVMRQMSAASPEEAKILQKMLFSFNDLPRLSPRARALLFDKVSIDAVVLSLRGMESEFRDIVLGSMASRSRRLVESELANASSAPAQEITKARKEIAELVLAKAQRNEIDLPAPVDD
jgi:flagellar motor switch protein FliG